MRLLSGYKTCGQQNKEYVGVSALVNSLKKACSLTKAQYTPAVSHRQDSEIAGCAKPIQLGSRKNAYLNRVCIEKRSMNHRKGSWRHAFFLFFGHHQSAPLGTPSFHHCGLAWQSRMSIIET